MGYMFKHLRDNHHLFFEMLPQDWQDEIIPHWAQYEDSASIYVIEEQDQIIGGGIVFSTCPPDILYYKKEAQNWFDNGYLYLGFIWISEDKRNMNLGSFWLEELKRTRPKQNYWLLIEEEHLHRFYQKNKFVLIKTVIQNKQMQWLYSYTSL
jgi:GNAT superfamily N-acetyltransferase